MSTSRQRLSAAEHSHILRLLHPLIVHSEARHRDAKVNSHILMNDLPGRSDQQGVALHLCSSLNDSLLTAAPMITISRAAFARRRLCICIRAWAQKVFGALVEDDGTCRSAAVTELCDNWTKDLSLADVLASPPGPDERALWSVPSGSDSPFRMSPMSAHETQAMDIALTARAQ